MLPPAARVIEKKSCFLQGTCYSDFSGSPCGPQDAVAWDALGALFQAYRGQPVENRHLAAKRAFDLCRNRHGHAMLSKLDHEKAFSLFKDAGV